MAKSLPAFPMAIAVGMLVVAVATGCAVVKQPPAPEPPAEPSPPVAPATLPQSLPPTPRADASAPPPSLPPTPPTVHKAPARPPAAVATTKAPPPVPPAPPPLPKTSPVPVAPSAAAAPLDLTSLETRLRETRAIGVLTKLSLKRQVDDLLAQFSAYHKRQSTAALPDLRRSFDLLLLKVLALLQDSDPVLAHDIGASRAALWNILVDPQKFSSAHLVAGVMQ
ncbi:MAG TPA: hypothetical protein VF277_06410 [Steroidobacteraceae bacterium]